MIALPRISKSLGLYRLWVAVLSVFFLLAINPMAGAVFADEYPDAYSDDAHSEELGVSLPPIDVVLLIDVSGSMRTTDPGRAALTAASDFIDMLTVGESRVGVVGFSGLIQYYFPLRLIDDESVQAELRHEITRFQYVGFTDIGAALLAAAEMLHHAEDVQNPMILLMSDGWIEISPQIAHRTVADSHADVETALDILERTVPVYTIGIHNPRGVDVELLEMIAAQSNAHAQFTDDANELPEMFISILEAHVATIEIDKTDEPEEVDEPIKEDPIFQPDAAMGAVPVPEPMPPSDLHPEPAYGSDYGYPTYEPLEYGSDTEHYYEYDGYNVENYYPTPFNRLVRGLLYTVAIIMGFTATINVIRFIRAVMK